MGTKPVANNSAGFSVKLWGILQAMLDDPSRGRPPTLAEVRAELQQTGVQWTGEGELLHPQDRTSLVIELDELIGRYGADAPVKSFVRVK